MISFPSELDSQEMFWVLIPDWTKDGTLQLPSHLEVELVFLKTVAKGEDVLCRLREPKEGQDQLMIKTLCGGMYWDLLDPVTCASTDVFVVVFFRSQLVLPKSGATERKYCFLSQIYRCGDSIFR